MKCAKAREMILLAQSGELPAGKQRKLETHIRACAECRTESTRLQWLSHAASSAFSGTAPSAEVMTRIHREAEEFRTAPVPRLVVWRPVYLLAMGAAASLALLTGIWFYYRPSPTDRLAELNALVSLLCENEAALPSHSDQRPDEAFRHTGWQLLRMEGLHVEDVSASAPTADELNGLQEPSPIAPQSRSTDAYADEIRG